MGAKGSSGSNNCCCTSCQTMPYTGSLSTTPIRFDDDQRISFQGHPVELITGFCCTCLPTYVCVSIACDSSDQRGQAFLRINCQGTRGTDDVAIVYTGSVNFLNAPHPAIFTLEVLEYNKCFFCLEIPSLGFTKQCVEITPEHQKLPFLWCQTMYYRLDEYGEYVTTEFTGDTYECGPVIVSISGANVEAITGRPKQKRDDYGVVGPAFEVGKIYDDRNSISNVCSGCGCIAKLACLTVFNTQTGSSAAYEMNLGCGGCAVECCTGHVYSSLLGDYGPLVSIVADPAIALDANGCDQDKDCYLQLNQLSPEQTFENLYAGPILKGVGPNNCPWPNVRWDIIDPVTLGLTIVDFRTDMCAATPCTINPAGCCVGIEMPITLHCTIARSGGTSPSSCDCLPVTIPMVFDGAGINPAWTGILDNTPGNGSWCVGDLRDFKLRLSCAGSKWQFQYGAGAIFQKSPCNGTVDSNPYTFSCRPVFFEFTVDGACCGPSGIPDGMGGFIPPPPQTLTFTITE